MIDFVRAYDGGVMAIDTGYGYQGYDDAYLIVDNGRAAFVDTGVNASVPRLLSALKEAGLTEEAVDWVLLTHVHLDHAGGAGELMARCPQARLGVHARGARHMNDPSQLMAAVVAVYGEEMVVREYGTLVPIPEARITVLEEGSEVRFGQRSLSVIDSPGHARHHLAFWDPLTEGWFTGDAFGLCVPGFRFEGGHGIYVSSSPSQFDPEVFPKTVEKMCARAPRYIYPTHAGRIPHPERLAPHLIEQVAAVQKVALELPESDHWETQLESKLLEVYTASLIRQGWQGTQDQARQTLGIDLHLNAQGVKIWRHQALMRK